MTRRLAAVLPSLAGGGAERVTLHLLAAVDQRRFSPRLLLLDGRGPLNVPPGFEVEVLDIPRLSHAAPALALALRRHRPDVTFSSLAYGNVTLAAMRPLFGGRLVVREAKLPSLSLRRTGMGRVLAAACSFLYPHIDRVLATSARMAAELEHMGVSPDCLTVLRNPVDVDHLRAVAAQPHRIAGPGLRVVAAGRLVPQKGFDRLLPLLHGFPDLHLTILGDGPQREELAALARQYGLALSLPGFRADAAAWYAGADAVLMPSRWEGMPNVALEALAVGTPVIATPESGGIGEVAAAAAPGAVTVAEFGADFAAALTALRPSESAIRRASLLPGEYTLPQVSEHFNAVLAGFCPP